MDTYRFEYGVFLLNKNIEMVVPFLNRFSMYKLTTIISSCLIVTFVPWTCDTHYPILRIYY